MKIGVISDTHDNLDNTRLVVEKLKKEKVEALIHCGDISAPFVIPILAELKVPVYVTLGNNEAELILMMAKINENENVKLMRPMGEIELGGKKIAFTHYPEFGTALAFTKKYDLVCHGHTHKTRNEVIGETLVLNPGEITNLKGNPTYAIYDTETNKAEILNLK